MLENVDLKQILALDIETVPQYPSWKDVPERTKDLWDKKTKLKRAADESPGDFYPRAGIWAEFGRIVCISVGKFDIEGGVISFRVRSFAGNDEHQILHNFSSLLARQSSNVSILAHNGKEFDLPYLCRRLLINQLEIPVQLNIAGKKPWEINHLDTLDLWKFGDHKNYSSLDLLAHIFDIPTSKDDIDGGDVHRVYWQDNDLERIKTYCQKDVITTAQLLLRFKGLPLMTEDRIRVIG